ncbi:MAG TPA: DUF924 family protein [Candidatus Binataceae bacterium]|nr:DUF924 family protein [Candidatus Binataceae bacterium]
MGRVEEILESWFGAADESGRRQVWFAPDPAFDRACSAGFLGDHEHAAAGDLDGWMDAPPGSLALALLLDQFPRNMFRGTARAFATDGKAWRSRNRRWRGNSTARCRQSGACSYICPSSTARISTINGSRCAGFANWRLRIRRWPDSSPMPSAISK